PCACGGEHRRTGAVCPPERHREPGDSCAPARLPRASIGASLATVGLRGVGRKQVARFSTGMQGRLALAQALLTDPALLILDEPQNGLDPEGILELRTLVRALAAQGKAVLVSSHLLAEVAQLADDIGVIARGVLRYQGPLAGRASDG